MTLKQLVASDLNLDRNVRCLVKDNVISFDLTAFQSKFIKSFLEIFKEHPFCLSYSENHIDMSLDMDDPQDQKISQDGFVSPWQNLQPMFLEPAQWDTPIPTGREEELLNLFVNGMLAEIKKKNGL